MPQRQPKKSPPKPFFTEPAAIQSAVRAFRNSSVFQSLKTRWEQDFDLYRLNAYNAGEGYYSYTTNKPLVVANKVISTLTQAQLQVRIPNDAILDEAQQEIATNIERLIMGCFTKNDEQLMMRSEPKLGNQMAWFSVVRGRFFIRAYIYKGDGNVTEVDIKIYDPYTSAYGRGAEGLAWFANIRKATASQIKDEFDMDMPTSDPFKEFDVYDYWDKVNHAVVIDNEWAENPLPHECGECPVYMAVVGAMPTTYHEHYQDTDVHRGESIFAPSRTIFPVRSKLISDWLNMVQRGLKVPLAVYSLGAKRTIDKDIFKTKQVATIPLDSNPAAPEKVEPLFEVSMPKDALPLAGILDQEEQLANLPNTSYGALNFRLSGFAVSQLQDATTTVISPSVQAMEFGFKVASLSLLRQFANKKLPAIEVRGRDSEGHSFGYPTGQKLKPADVEGNWFPEITLTPKMPRDDVEKINLARLATGGDRPLLSLETARDSILQLQDVRAEELKVNKEWAKTQVPSVRLHLAWIAATTAGRGDIAQLLKLEQQRLMLSSIQMPGRPGVTPPPTQPQGGMPGVGGGSPVDLLAGMGGGLPPSPTGVENTTMPPEQLGQLPGGTVNAAGLGGGESAIPPEGV